MPTSPMQKRDAYVHIFNQVCIMLAATLLLGCYSEAIAKEFPQVPSYAIVQKENCALKEALKDDVAAHPGQSGFRLLTTGSESFSMRLAMIEAAEKTLDLQYYSIHDDTTTNLLLEAVVRAARRGVRIRFLLDNINFGAVDKTFSVLDGFKNLEIRIFNPFVTRKHGLLSRTARVLTDIDSLNRRMHNKALIADNQLAIIGGRNLGDEYFEENTDVMFRDMDILTAGPITAHISHSFDTYWNSKNAVPVGQLKQPVRNPEEVAAIRARLEDQWDTVLHTEKGKKLLQSPLKNRLKQGDISFIWAKSELVVDEPQKVDKGRDEAESKPLTRLGDLLEKSKYEFIAVSPYFVPRDTGVDYLAALVERGVKVRIITNSLASTDVVAVHTGYRRYREALLDSGIELYEMKQTGDERPRQRLIGRKAPAAASLHSKVYVIDRKEVMIGSFNLDPRSVELNTEIGLVIHSPQLAAQVIKMFDEVTAPENSYKLAHDEDDDLVWKAKERDEEVQFTRDPKAGIWRNIQVELMALMPLEDHL